MSAVAATSLVTALLTAISSGFGWALERLKLKNSAAMQANAAAQTEQRLKDSATKTVAKGDIDAVRKAVAE